MPRNNSNMPKVSIVLCSYNGERYISDQVESILKQTYSNLELIISDDCSSDTTVSILRKYEKFDGRVVKIIENDINVGLAKNFERGLRVATGEYIAMSDQDDYWLPTKIEKQILFLQNNKNCSLVYHDSLIVNHSLRPLGGTFVQKLKGNTFDLQGQKTNDNRLVNLLQKNHIQGATMLFRRELIDSIMPIPKELIFVDVWVVLIAASFSKIGYMDVVLLKYRQHENNVIGAKVKNGSFYKKSFFDKGFAENYSESVVTYLGILSILRDRMGVASAKQCKVVCEKIVCLSAVVDFINSKGLIDSAKAYFRAVKVIFPAKQKNHLSILTYFLAYKMNFKKK